MINDELLKQVCLQLVLDLGVPSMMLLATSRMLMIGYVCMINRITMKLCGTRIEMFLSVGEGNKILMVQKL